MSSNFEFRVFATDSQGNLKITSSFINPQGLVPLPSIIPVDQTKDLVNEYIKDQPGFPTEIFPQYERYKDFFFMNWDLFDNQDFIKTASVVVGYQANQNYLVVCKKNT